MTRAAVASASLAGMLALGSAGCSATSGDPVDGRGSSTTGGTPGEMTGGTGSGGEPSGPASGGTASGIGGAPGTGGASPNASGGTGTSSAPGSAEIQLPYSEDFEDGAAGGWIADVDDELGPLGSWTIVDEGGNQVYQQQQLTSDPTWAVGGDYHWTDQRFEMRFKFLTGAEDGLVIVAARLSDFDHYYYLEIADTDIELRIRNDGNADVMEWSNPAQVVGDEWHTVALSAIGTTLTVEWDGSVVMTATDSQLVNGGIGLAVRDASVAFDDILVSAQ